MTAIVNSLFNAAQKRIAFNRTVAEIEAMHAMWHSIWEFSVKTPR